MRLLSPLLLITATGLVAPAASAQAAETRAHAEGRFIRALTQHYLNNDSAAVRLYAQALELRPTDPAILDGIAEAYFALGQTTDALYHATLAVDAAPDHPAAHLRLGTILEQTGQNDLALASLETAHRLAPLDSRAASALSRLYLRLGRDSDAQSVRTSMGPLGESLRSDESLGPNKVPPATTSRPSTSGSSATDELPGAAAFREGRFAEAAEQLLLVVQTSPRRLDAWALVLDALAQSADPRSGPTADDATLLFPTVPSILAPAADAYLAANRPEDARAAADAGLAALDSGTDDPELRARLLRTLASLDGR